MKRRQRQYGIPGFIALTIAAACCALPGPAAADDDRRYKIEAAFLYNFFNYITWPGYDSPQALKSPTICVYGEDALEPYLTYIQHKVNAERNLSVRMLQKGDHAKNCHLLFIHGENNFKGTLGGDTLIISDNIGYIEAGGMIELSQENERMLMKINHSLLEQSGFSVSSRLLSLAQRVE